MGSLMGSGNSSFAVLAQTPQMDASPGSLAQELRAQPLPPGICSWSRVGETRHRKCPGGGQQSPQSLDSPSTCQGAALSRTGWTLVSPQDRVRDRQQSPARPQAGFPRSQLCKALNKSAATWLFSLERAGGLVTQRASGPETPWQWTCGPLQSLRPTSWHCPLGPCLHPYPSGQRDCRSSGSH